MVELDCGYVANRSLRRDLGIIARTVVVVLLGRGDLLERLTKRGTRFPASPTRRQGHQPADPSLAHSGWYQTADALPSISLEAGSKSSWDGSRPVRASDSISRRPAPFVERSCSNAWTPNSSVRVRDVVGGIPGGYRPGRRSLRQRTARRQDPIGGSGGGGRLGGVRLQSAHDARRCPAVAPANESTPWYTSPISSGGTTLESTVPLAKTPDGQNIDLFFGATPPYGPSVAAGRAKDLLAAPLQLETVESTTPATETESTPSPPMLSSPR